ncbi:IS4 family transposase [bacterium]|nr:IS4 family transposase [bacterium]
MADDSVKKSKGRKKKERIKEEDLQRFKLIHKVIPLLKDLHPVKDCHNRKLHFDQYISLILFYFFNPILTSLRGIQQVSRFKKVKKLLNVEGTSLGSLSEAGSVFDADLIAPLIKQLAKKAIPLEKDPKLKVLQQALVAVDGTLLPALPKMLWALWLDDQHRAAKLHLEFDILKSAPTNARITDGNGNERTVLRGFLCSDKLYVLDAGYSEYKLFDDIINAHSSFVGRLKNNAVWDTLENRPLTDDDKRMGVQRDMIVRLGHKGKQDDLTRPVRVVEVFCQGDSSRPRKSRVSSKKTKRSTGSDYTLLLVTDRMDLPAEIIALIFRYRWQVELFFRWFKCILGCTHLISLSENGVSVQVYCALIASMLITLWTGCKPNKRTFEMLCFYFMGWADDEELAQHIKRLKGTSEKKKKV